MCTEVSFDSSMDCERTFLMDLFPKNVKNWFQHLPTSEFFLFDFTNNQTELGFMMLAGLRGEAVESFSGYALS